MNGELTFQRIDELLGGELSDIKLGTSYAWDTATDELIAELEKREDILSGWKDGRLC